MLLILADYLQQYHSGFNMFRYLTLRGILGALTALLISLWIGPTMIRRLASYKIGQVVRDDGPETHLSKSGTPTMGGALILIGALATGIAGHTLPHYGIALVLLGVGWNFLYIGGTTLLTFSYRNAERFKVQAVNDFSVFGLSATGSLLAGTIMFQFGWLVTVAAPLPLLLLVLIALAGVRGHPRLVAS